MNILMVNQSWFADELRAAGHTVTTCGLQANLDIEIGLPMVHIDTVIEKHLDGVSPDFVIIHDNSAPIFLTGIEEADYPVLFYSVDTHHHQELHIHIGHVVDAMFVAQKDYLADVQAAAHAPVEWLPLWAPRHVEASNERKYDVCFVGTMKRSLNPERVEFFEKLKQEVDVFCTLGAYWEYFPYSEIVINQTVKKDLNFRVFEAMMCGTLFLLTEATDNGLFDLFQDKKHFVTYEKNNVSDAVEKIRYYLSHREEARTIAEAGRAEVLRAHCAEHRAAQLVCAVERLKKKQPSPVHYLSWMMNCDALGYRLLTLDTVLAERAFVYALKTFENAMNREVLTADFAYAFVHSCCQYDRMTFQRTGHQLIERVLEQYPDLSILRMALIREALNRGELNNAKHYATYYSEIDEKKVFETAEEAIIRLVEYQERTPDEQVQI